MDFKPLITLLAIVPFFIHYTHDFTRAQRKRTIWISSFSAFVVIAVSALQDRHQRHDALDGPDIGSPLGRGDVGRVGEIVSGVGTLGQLRRAH